MSGVNPRELISEIKKRPGIYDKSALLPPCREHKHQLWLEVAETLTPAEDWDSYSDIEKDARIDEIAAKWKHVKTNFHRDVKLEEAGQSHKKRKYVYFNELEFMRPFVGVRLPKRENTSVDSLDDLMGNDDTDLEMDSLLKCNDDAGEATNKINANECSVADERITRSSKRVIKPTQKAMENKASSSTTAPVVSRPQKETVIKTVQPGKKPTGGSGTANASFKIRDGDISFCLSLVPTLRKLGDGRKLKAKIEILKILHRYVNHIERRNRSIKSNCNNNADIEDDVTEDHLEEYDDGIIIKNEEHDDPFHGNNGNNKTWWT